MFYLTFATGGLFVDRNIEKVCEFRQQSGLDSLPAERAVRRALRLPVVRIAGLAILGMAVLIPQILAGAAILPAAAVIAAGLMSLGVWTYAVADQLTVKAMITPRNILVGSIFMGGLISSVRVGPFSNEAALLFSALVQQPVNSISGIGMGIEKFMIMTGFAPYVQAPALDGEVAVKTATPASNVLTGPLFDVPYRLSMGLSGKMLGKSSQRVLGADFTEAAAQALIRSIRKREEAHNGVKYKPGDSRPLQGGFALISDEAVSQMLEVLTALGLRKFEDSVPVDFFIKPTVLVNQDAIAPTPIESEIVFKAPLTDHEEVELLFRVVIMDPLFVDEQGQNLNLTQLPERWIEQVLNVMNPAAIFKIAGQQLPVLFARAVNLEAGYKGIFGAMVKKWQGKTTPTDAKVLRQFLTLGLLHEFTHALALHMPDRIPATMPQQEQERLGKFSVAQYLNLLSSSGELQQSTVFIKNLIKALSEVQKLDPSPATQNQTTRIIALEMFCDRFSMFMFETFRRLQIYHEGLPDFGDPFPIEMLKNIERERRTNPAAMKQKYGLTDATLARLSAAEKEHVYISTFGDPAILDSERAIFEPFLELLRHFDRQKTIMGFTEDHTRGELFLGSNNGSFNAEEKLGADQIVELGGDL